jgi:integrase
MDSVNEKEVLPANLLRRSNGILYTRVMIKGRDIWRSTGYTTVKMATRKAEEIRTKLRNEEDWGKDLSPTFREYVEGTYLPVYTAQKNAPGRDQEILAHALPFFGRKRLDEINKSLCVRYINDRLRVAAASTVNRERGTVQAIFQRALEDGLIDRNPWQGIEREIEKPRVRVLTLENEAKLREVLTPRYNRWLTFMLGTGLRLEEARSVHIGRVDFLNELIHVPAEAAKFGKARSVPLRPEVAKVIREQQEEIGYLWPSNQQNYRDVLAAKCRTAKVPHISPHDLRHTFATRYLQGGGDIYILSKILGHSSVKMTEKVYAHLLSEDLVERSRGVQIRMAI